MVAGLLVLLFAVLRRKARKNIAVGHAHIKTSFNNTIVTFVDPGDVFKIDPDLVFHVNLGLVLSKGHKAGLLAAHDRPGAAAPAQDRDCAETASAIFEQVSPSVVQIFSLAIDPFLVADRVAGRPLVASTRRTRQGVPGEWC